MANRGLVATLAPCMFSIVRCTAVSGSLTFSEMPVNDQSYRTGARILSFRSHFLRRPSSPFNLLSSNSSSISFLWHRSVSQMAVPSDVQTPQNRPRSFTELVLWILVGVAIAIFLLSLTLLIIRMGKPAQAQRQVLQKRNAHLDIEFILSRIRLRKENSDPFLTDAEARGMGYELSQQTTRRLEAQFSPRLTPPDGLPSSGPEISSPEKISTNQTTELGVSPASSPGATRAPGLPMISPPKIPAPTAAPAPSPQRMRDLLSQLDPAHARERYSPIFTSLRTPSPSPSTPTDIKVTAL